MHASSYTLEGAIPATRMHNLQQQLPTLTRGEGLLEIAFDHYQMIDDPTPSRPRSDNNPLDRKEYLQLLRRAAGSSEGV